MYNRTVMRWSAQPGFQRSGILIQVLFITLRTHLLSSTPESDSVSSQFKPARPPLLCSVTAVSYFPSTHLRVFLCFSSHPENLIYWVLSAGFAPTVLQLGCRYRTDARLQSDLSFPVIVFFFRLARVRA